MEAKKMRRSDAARALDDIREMLAERKAPEEIERILQLQYQIEPLTKCTGEAHSNPHIDNCMCCAPRWEWVGAEIKIT